ncbi:MULTISPECIES: hypothetical protein [Nostoc]|nr:MULTISPECIES: hypothetical protein [Nostoc]
MTKIHAVFATGDAFSFTDATANGKASLPDATHNPTLRQRKSM